MYEKIDDWFDYTRLKGMKIVSFFFFLWKFFDGLPLPVSGSGLDFFYSDALNFSRFL